MSLRVARGLGLCLVAAGLASCGSGGSQTTLLINKDDGWSFPVPAGLKKTNAKLPSGYLQFASPFVNKERTTLVIISVLDNHSAAEEGEDIVKNPPEGLAIQTSGAYPVGGKDGFTIVATTNGGKITQRQVIIRGTQVNVTMTLTVVTAEFDQWDQKFQESLKGFRWTD